MQSLITDRFRKGFRKPAPSPQKLERAKYAKQTINRLIPEILSTNSRAKDGVRHSTLIRYGPKKLLGSTASPNQTVSNPASPPLPTPKVTVIQSDTYDAALSILSSRPPTSTGRVAVLNMANAVHAGGGVLNGAIAQEESLCLRSTLFPSLKEAFYRVPEDAAIYTPDVLIFRSSSGVDLSPSARWFCDVISVAAIRNPDVVKIPGTGVWEYEYEWDEEVMRMKVKIILQVARQRGITHLVLGALGCGAFHNPPKQVAEIFKEVIEGWEEAKGIEEIVFAIFDDGENLAAFKGAFGVGVGGRVWE